MNRPAAIVASVGLVLATVYALWMVQRVFHGRAATAAPRADAAEDGTPPAGGLQPGGVAVRGGPEVARSPAHASKVGPSRRLRDLSAREMAMLAVCVIVVLWLGLFPQTFIRTAKPAVDYLQHLTSGTTVITPDPALPSAVPAAPQETPPDAGQNVDSPVSPPSRAGR